MREPSDAGLKLGWSGPHELLEKRDALALAELIERYLPKFTAAKEFGRPEFVPDFGMRPWFKSLHAYIPELFALVSHPRLVEHVLPILGTNVIAWGVSLTVRLPGQVHRWHVDIEHLCWPGVTIFVGLANSDRAGLKFIDCSHEISPTPQAGNLINDSDVLSAARRHSPTARISEPVLTDGSFLVFGGRTWHGSVNRGNETRLGMVIQYAAVSAQVAIPLNWDKPIRWHPYRPPCVLVSGVATPPNNIILHPLSIAGACG